MQDKESAMAALRERARDAHPGEAFAFGEGSPDADLVVVGEAPGEEEARAGRPFVGPAGKILDELLQSVGLDRSRIWITNVVKTRPTRTVGKRVVNRAPQVGEVQADRPWLEEELQIIQPRVVLCLGNVAASALIHRDFRMNAEHGRGFQGPLEARTMATFHPAWILRQVGTERDRAMEMTRADFEKAKMELKNPS
jgi:uracil-DNA glycosylase